MSGISLTNDKAKVYAVASLVYLAASPLVGLVRTATAVYYLFAHHIFEVEMRSRMEKKMEGWKSVTDRVPDWVKNTKAGTLLKELAEDPTIKRSAGLKARWKEQAERGISECVPLLAPAYWILRDFTRESSGSGQPLFHNFLDAKRVQVLLQDEQEFCRDVRAAIAAER